MRWLLLSIGAVLVFAACGGTPSDGDVSEHGWRGEGGGVATKTVTVDGVRCILADTYDGVAISCDWTASGAP